MMMDTQLLAEMIDAYLAEGQLGALVYAFLFSIVAAFLLLAVFFFLKAVGLYRINKRLGNKHAWLAFIPGLSGYALGAAADGLKKRKPSNYCIHMMMLNTFYVLLYVVYYIYVGGRFLFLYEKLAAGGVTDTLALLERVFVIDSGDKVLYLVNMALSLLSYVVTFVSLLCYMRILQLFRKGGFFLLLCTLFVSQTMDVYLFAMREKPLYPNPPVFRMPDGTTFGGNGSDDEYSGSGGNDFYTDRDEPYGDGSDNSDNSDDDSSDHDRTDNGDNSDDGEDNDPKNGDDR